MRSRLVTVFLALAVAAIARAEPVGSFRLTLDPATQSEPYTGRVYVILGDQRGEPRERMGAWFRGPQIFALDVADIAPGASINITAPDLAHPSPYADVKPGTYHIQAVARRSLDSPSPGQGPGDLYSAVVQADFAPGAPAVLDLRLDKVVEESPFVETDRVRLFEMQSPSLSDFYGRPITMRAGVILPRDWKDDPTLRHPTLYFITGFGSTHETAFGIQGMFSGDNAADLLIVVPDPTTPLGHSVFADSANNGPRGHALIHELIPAIEEKFHGALDPERRYVTGISSGGWSSLWLQVEYPDAFAACWSHCPDPVTFEDFQRIDLTRPGSNFYVDDSGKRRPLARQGDRVFLWYDDFVHMETVLGPGGQIHAFEAVFSPRGPDGKPLPVFDRASGAVNPDVAATWETYDIRRKLENNWHALAPKLKGKLHVYAGELDTFYLEGATRLLQQSLAGLGSDAEVVIVPGMPHTMWPDGIEKMLDEIAASEAVR